MSRKVQTRISLLIILSALSLWTLAPYGGCSCLNPLDPDTPGHSSTSGPTPTPLPTQGPLINDWEDADYNNSWGGGLPVTAFDAYGSSEAVVISSPGSNIAGGTPGSCIRISGTIVKDGPPNYPYCQLLNDLAGARNLAANFPSYKSIKFMAKSLVVPATYRVVVVSSGIITDFGYWSMNFTPVDNNWHQYHAFFPEAGVAGNPAQSGVNNGSEPNSKLKQYFGVVKPWLTVKTDVERVDIIVVPKAGVSSNYDLSVDDLSFSTDTF